MKPSIIRLRALEKQLYAYLYAMTVIDFDAQSRKIRRNELRRMRNVLLRMSCGSADSAAYQSSQG